MKKAVICTVCNHQYHQDVLNPMAITVHPCRNCGKAGTMIMGPGQPNKTGTAAVPFAKPKIAYPLLSVPVNHSLLSAGPSDVDQLHMAATGVGFTLVGFHGCGSTAAGSIMTAVRDVSTTNARGRGFMVGSKYDGIPQTWAAQVKGGGTATILRIYVSGWGGMVRGTHYECGKMDPDDDASETGLEMVLKVAIFGNILALPSKSTDASLNLSAVWAGCPSHSFRPKEVPTMTRVADHLHVTLDQLEAMIEAGGTQVQRVEAAFATLGLSTAAVDSDDD